MGQGKQVLPAKTSVKARVAVVKTDTRKPLVEYRGTGYYLSLVVILILVVLFLVLSVQNTAAVQFEFLWWAFEIPLFGLLIAAALVAVVLDELIGLAWRRSRRQRLTEQHELATLRQQVEEASPAGEGVAETGPADPTDAADPTDPTDAADPADSPERSEP